MKTFTIRYRTSGTYRLNEMVVEAESIIKALNDFKAVARRRQRRVHPQGNVIVRVGNILVNYKCRYDEFEQTPDVQIEKYNQAYNQQQKETPNE